MKKFLHVKKILCVRLETCLAYTADFFEEVKKRAGDFRGKFWVWNTLISTVFYLIYLLLVGKLAEHAIHTLLLLVQNTDGPFTSNNFEKRKILSADFAWVFHMKGLCSHSTECSRKVTLKTFHLKIYGSHIGTDEIHSRKKTFSKPSTQLRIKLYVSSKSKLNMCKLFPSSVKSNESTNIFCTNKALSVHSLNFHGFCFKEF